MAQRESIAFLDNLIANEQARPIRSELEELKKIIVDESKNINVKSNVDKSSEAKVLNGKKPRIITTELIDAC
jgi:hypothetical protein